MLRFLDVVLSATALVVLIPFFILVGIWIKLDSKGGVLYIQKRVGQYGRDFNLFKLRSMRLASDQIGLLTVGDRDPRITNTGYFIRKYKIDELPQLWNVLIGDMSFVGPRPEVRKYVELYDERQRKVLKVKPGITDEASIAFRKENDLLSKSSNPEETYILEIMPAKIELNMKFIECPTLWNYFRIILKTIF